MPPQAADPHVSEEERAQLLEWLDESHRRFARAISSVSDAQWTWKPEPREWSVGETAEHVVLAEALLFSFVRKAIAGAPNPGWEEQTRGKTELLVRLLPSGEGNAVAPDPIVPRAGLTHAQVTERFEQQRKDIAQFARETEIALKAHTITHPFPIFGTLNAYQWLIYVPLHTLHHGKQIANVKAATGYPS